MDFEFKFWWDFVAGSDKKALNIQAIVYFLSSFELRAISNERLGPVAYNLALNFQHRHNPNHNCQYLVILIIITSRVRSIDSSFEVAICADHISLNVLDVRHTARYLSIMLQNDNGANQKQCF